MASFFDSNDEESHEPLTIHPEAAEDFKFEDGSFLHIQKKVMLTHQHGFEPVDPTTKLQLLRFSS